MKNECNFREEVRGCARYVCGVRRFGNGKSVSECWDEVMILISQMRKRIYVLLRETIVLWNGKQRRLEQMESNLGENKMMFWWEVCRIRKSEEEMFHWGVEKARNRRWEMWRVRVKRKRKINSINEKDGVKVLKKWKSGICWVKWDCSRVLIKWRRGVGSNSSEDNLMRLRVWVIWSTLTTHMKHTMSLLF